MVKNVINVGLAGIYRLDFLSGHFYIGQSSNVIKRWRQHRSKFKHGSMRQHHPKLFNIWDKYGEPAFTILAFCEIEEMTYVEQQLITEYWGNPLFANTNSDATTSRGVKRTHVSWQTGKEFTAIHRQRLSDAKQGRVSGIHNSNAKLTESQVREIKAKYRKQVKGSGSTTLAKMYGVSYMTILYIVHGKRYADVV